MSKRLAILFLLIGVFWLFGCLPKKNLPPIAAFTFTPSAPKVGEVITFDATRSKDPDGRLVSFHWDFGDGNTDSGMTVSHSYNADGSYKVVLTVEDNKGAKGSTSKTIRVGAIATPGPVGPRVVARLNSPTPDPTGLAWDGTYLWLADAENLKIYKLDPKDGRVLGSFDAPGEFPQGLVWAQGSLWHVDGQTWKIYKLNPDNGKILAAFDFTEGTDPTGLTWDGAHLWLADAENAELHKIDPKSGEVIDSFDAPGDFPEGLAWDGTNLWNVDAEEGFFKININDGEILEHIEFTPTPEPRGLVWDGTNLWLVDAENGKILKLAF